ncbi:MAG: carboxymuconolactone decarboxylase family protein [Thiohalomonadales bacterium]
MNNNEELKQIDDFEAHYKYDSTYMRELLKYSPVGYAKFSAFIPLSSHKEKLSIDEYWVAKLAAMQVEDCGECLQLNVRMALEAGVNKNIIEAVIKEDSALLGNLADVYRYAKDVAAHKQIEASLMDRIESKYDKGMLLEFGLCIATAKVFPTIKRAMGYTKSCNLIEIEV